jgi:hypothetical protein
MVLRRGRFVGAVVFLRLAQELGQLLDLHDQFSFRYA